MHDPARGGPERGPSFAKRNEGGRGRAAEATQPRDRTSYLTSTHEWTIDLYPLKTNQGTESK
jgi:hypothetical protein